MSNSTDVISEFVSEVDQQLDAVEAELDELEVEDLNETQAIEEVGCKGGGCKRGCKGKRGGGCGMGSCVGLVKKIKQEAGFEPNFVEV